MELDYVTGISLEIVDAVPSPTETFNALSSISFRDLLITSHPVFPEWYSYKDVFEFTLSEPDLNSRVFMWDGHSEGFRVPGEHREFYLHLITQALLEKYPDFTTCTVDLRETEVVDGVRGETEWGWRLFAYRRCAGKAGNGKFLVVTRESVVSEADPGSDEVVTFLAERVSGYDVVHSMGSEEYAALTKLVFGVKREPYREWENFLKLATGDFLVVMDEDFSSRGDVLAHLGGGGE